jgi:competence protein ComEC
MRQLILILILANLFLGIILFNVWTEKNYVAFLDVGQGESVLIKSRNNIFLYDTGKYPYLVLKELDRLMPFYNKKIDILFLSHPDKDHYFAAFEILKRYKVRMIMTNTLVSKDATFQELLGFANKLKIPVIAIKYGTQINDNHFKFFVLHPDKMYSKDNDSSLVIKVVGNKSYLLTGDIEHQAIQRLIDCCQKFLGADILLVPHHGSRYSMNEEFYNLVKPLLSVISVGKNSYGHPHQEVLRILKNIWRTDFNHTLIVNE